jgi:hypothetical protein
MSTLASSLPTIHERCSWFGIEENDDADERLDDDESIQNTGSLKSREQHESNLSPTLIPHVVCHSVAPSVSTPKLLSPASSHNNLAGMATASASSSASTSATAPAQSSPSGFATLINVPFKPVDPPPGAGWYYGLTGDEEAEEDEDDD